MTLDDLAQLDRITVQRLTALAHVRPASNQSYATPHLFATDSGKACWLKKNSQHGLFAELIAGRLAAKVGAGPKAHVVSVPHAALPAGGAADAFEGLCMGTEDLQNTENSRDLMGRNVVLTDAMIDRDQRALVVAFQTWVGVTDLQVLVDVTNGRIFSHDHGDCFGATNGPTDPALAISPLGGVSDRHGCEPTCVARAIGRVQSCSDDDLLHAVANIPPEWGADAPRRLSIAEWLAYRRDKLQEAMTAW